jgi:hypothetical protein
MAKRNQHTKVVPDTCNVCGKEKGGIIVAKTARFKANKKHSTGPCPECKKSITDMADMMMAGGTMVVCTICGGVSVVMEVPPTLQPRIAQMPDGGKRLEMAGCPLCTKENTDVTQPATDGPDLGQQPGVQD